MYPEGAEDWRGWTEDHTKAIEELLSAFPGVTLHSGPKVVSGPDGRRVYFYLQRKVGDGTLYCAVSVSTFGDAHTLVDELATVAEKMLEED